MSTATARASLTSSNTSTSGTTRDLRGRAVTAATRRVYRHTRCDARENVLRPYNSTIERNAMWRFCVTTMTECYLLCVITVERGASMLAEASSDSFV